MIRIPCEKYPSLRPEEINEVLRKFGFNYDTAILSREVDENGRAVLDKDGNIVPTTRYILVKANPSLDEQKQIKMCIQNFLNQ